MLYLLMQFHHVGWGFIHCFGNTCYLVLYKLGYPDTLHGFLYSIIYSLIQSTNIRSSASWLAQVSKESTCGTGDIGDTSSIPGLGRSPGGERGNPLQYSCLENPMDKEAWWAAVHRIAKSQTWLKRLNIQACRVQPTGFKALEVYSWIIKAPAHKEFIF